MHANDAARIREFFPNDLLQQKRWAVSMEGQKRPYCPQIPEGYGSVSECSSVDPGTWFDFETCATAPNPMMSRVGLFMDPEDRVVVVDIDDINEHESIKAVTEHLPNTYVEYSWSGNPDNRKMHIFVYGDLPANFKAPGIEAYKADRYIGVTGNAINGAAPITEQQQLLDWLWETFGRDHQLEHISLDPADLQPGMAEEIILEKLNDKSVWDGTSTNPYFRHPAGTEKAGCFNSEAEAALAARLAMITDDLQSILRIMAASPMIQEMADYPWHNRKKILGRLVNHTIPSALSAAQRANEKNNAESEHGAGLASQLLQCFNKKDSEQACKRMEEARACTLTTTPEITNHVQGRGFKPVAPVLCASEVQADLMDRLIQPCDCTFPFGLVGEVANHIYSSGYFPLAKGSLMSAFVMCAGIFSNRYYFRGTGLNLYCLLTAGVGEGKDALISTPMTMLQQLQDEATLLHPDGTHHDYYTRYLANGTFTSKKAIMRLFEKRRGVSVLMDEIGKDWATMLRPNASAVKVELKSFLLSAYGRSGPDKKFDGTTYANEEDDTGVLVGRNLTVFGVSSPAAFYDAVQSDDVGDGFFARFLMTSDASTNVGYNPNHGHPMNDALANVLATACDTCPSYIDDAVMQGVGITEDAEEMLIAVQMAYKKKKDSYSDMDMRKSLVSRASQNMNRIAAIVAVGRYFWNPPYYQQYGGIPTIEKQDLEYAFGYVADSLYRVFEEVKTGVFDPNNDARIKQVISIVHKTISGNMALNGAAQDLMKKGYIDRNHIMAKLGTAKQWQAEKNYGRDKSYLLDQVLQEMVKRCYLEEVGAAQQTELKTRRKVYRIGEAFEEAVKTYQS